MKLSGPTIMLHFSVTRHVDRRKVNTGLDFFDVVLIASWSTQHGDSEISTSERWRQVAPNMWQVMSRKK